MRGETSFGGAGTSKMFALGAGAELVQVRSGEAMVAQYKRSAPDFVKIDVEGSEGETLEGLLEVLPLTARLFIAMHSKQADMKCSALLEGAGWQCVPSGGLQQSRRGQWQSDPDLFCMGPEYAGCDADLVTLRKANF